MRQCGISGRSEVQAGGETKHAIQVKSGEKQDKHWKKTVTASELRDTGLIAAKTKADAGLVKQSNEGSDLRPLGKHQAQKKKNRARDEMKKKIKRKSVTQTWVGGGGMWTWPGTKEQKEIGSSLTHLEKRESVGKKKKLTIRGAG